MKSINEKKDLVVNKYMNLIIASFHWVLSKCPIPQYAFYMWSHLVILFPEMDVPCWMDQKGQPPSPLALAIFVCASAPLTLATSVVIISPGLLVGTSCSHAVDFPF